MTGLPDYAQVVRFYPKRGLGYKHEKDHLALEGVDQTFCGIPINNGRSSGTHMQAPFDVKADYSCQRCLAGLRRHGPVRVFSRISWFDPGRTDLVEVSS